jgi:hypothetical protein
MLLKLQHRRHRNLQTQKREYLSLTSLRILIRAALFGIWIFPGMSHIWILISVKVPFEFEIILMMNDIHFIFEVLTGDYEDYCLLGCEGV